jgi:NADH:ubiquinone oxidoreductase subunit 2 (subunit N)
MPLLLILVGIGLSLAFEVSGVNEGFRRYGNKNYISLTTAIAIISVFILVFQAEANDISPKGGLIFDSVSKSAILSLSLLGLCTLWIVIERLKPENADSGEIYALTLCTYFFSILIACSESWPLLSSAYLASMSTQIGILALRKKRRTSPEVALKWIISAAFLLVFFALLFFLSISATQPATVVFGILLTLIILGAVPLQSHHVDVLDGTPSYSAVFYVGSTLINSTIIFWRLSHSASLSADILERITWVLMIFAAISFCVGPIMALDQRRMSRLLAYLLASQAGLVLIFAALFFSHIEIPLYLYGYLFTHFVLCAAGSYAGLNYWKNARHAFRTWEDFAGAGRKHPLESGAFFLVLASICGLPFTSGFVLRTQLIGLAPPAIRVPILIILFASIVLSAVPVLRLFAFFFGKTARHELTEHHRHRQITLLYMCATILFLAALAPLSVLRFVFDFSQK